MNEPLVFAGSLSSKLSIGFFHLVTQFRLFDDVTSRTRQPKSFVFERRGANADEGEVVGGGFGARLVHNIRARLHKIQTFHK